MAARHLEVLTRRCRTQSTWLWPCGRKRWDSFDVSGYQIMVVAMWDQMVDFFWCAYDIKTWLWSCGMKEGNFLGIINWIYNIFIYIWWFDISSPYLFVFGDDRVRGTREQMILQVVLVRHRLRVWASLGIYQSFNIFLNQL